MNQEDENIKYFASGMDGSLVKIIVCAVVFHFLVVAGCIAFHYVNFKSEPEPIPVFEMVQVAQPRPPAPPKTQPPPPNPRPSGRCCAASAATGGWCCCRWGFRR